MSKISVANGWQHILAEAVAKASRLPPEWLFEITQAETVDGALRLSATYMSGDVPLDEHLPPERKLPHPWRSMMRIREQAREKSLQTCECCGRRGKVIGAGDEARVRCAAHEEVVDAMTWVSPVGVMFETEQEAMAHFLDDYGDGLDLMQEAQRGGLLNVDDEDYDDTRH